MFKRLFSLFCAMEFCSFAALAQTEGNVSKPEPSAPPPPFSVGHPALKNSAPKTAQTAASFYSIGNPTDEEQLFLELVNRARANPAQEGLLLSNSTDPDILRYVSFFNVNLDAFVLAMSKIPPAQPLAMNAALTAAARVHSQDMFNNTYQEHISPIDGTNPYDRAVAEGYPQDAFAVAENIYVQAQSVLHGHTGFEIDWGNDAAAVNGMQNPPHHRETIHSPGLREVGMGVLLGEKSALPGEDHQDVGPVLITQDFGQAQQADQHPFITGVAYFDFNGNGQYDLGEGLGGVKVTAEGSDIASITADAGGYAIPVTPNRTYRVTFSASGIESKGFDAIVATNNVKIDFKPLYTAPTLVGPNPALTLRTNTYQFGAVGSAVGYQWRKWTRSPTVIEGAENGLNKISATVAIDAPAIVTDVKISGTHSFHMVHTGDETGKVPQIIALDRFFLVNAGATLQYSNRLAHAAVSETARTQISVDEGVTWQDLNAQVGSGGIGQIVFAPKTLSLASYAGKIIKVRFVYDIGAGSFSFGSVGYGWYIDDIGFTNVEELSNPSITGAGSEPHFDFAPEVAGNFTLEARAQLQNRLLPWGAVMSVTAVPGPAIVHLSDIKALARGLLQIDFNLDVGTNSSFTLQSAAAFGGPSPTWTSETVAATSTGLNGFRFVLPRADPAMRFYRVLVN
jgi:hypothetical protein